MTHGKRNIPLSAALILFAGITLYACGGGQDDGAAQPLVVADDSVELPAAREEAERAFCRGKSNSHDQAHTRDQRDPDEARRAFCRGKSNFHDRTLAGLGGNGRACSDCHMDAEHFQLTPAAAQARFAQMTRTGVDDPLFRAIDADDFRVNGAAAHDFTNLTQNGLIRITIALPANVKLFDCGATVACPASARPTSETVADVWRSVPSIRDVAITGPDGVDPAASRGPNPRGGYQLDGRIDTLQNQALSALRNHAGITADPPASFLDDVASFQSAQFSSRRVKALSNAITAGTSPLPDPDPVLNALETAGKSVFNRSCAQCHGNQAGHPSGSTPIAQGTLVRQHRGFGT